MPEKATSENQPFTIGDLKKLLKKYDWSFDHIPIAIEAGPDCPVLLSGSIPVVVQEITFSTGIAEKPETERTYATAGTPARLSFVAGKKLFGVPDLIARPKQI